MALKIVDRAGVCSTLSVTSVCIDEGEFIKRYYGGVKKYIIHQLKNQIKAAPAATETRYDLYETGNKVTIKALDDFPVEDFAFFYSTVFMSSIYAKSRKALTELGFEVLEAMGTYNKKNRTTVCPVIGSVHVILAELAKYDEKGNPIKQDVEGGVVKKAAVAMSKRKKIPERQISHLAQLRNAA